MMNWISIQKEFPPKNTEIFAWLVIGEVEYPVLAFHTIQGHIYYKREDGSDNRDVTKTVTHWMIPEAPV